MSGMIASAWAGNVRQTVPPNTCYTTEVGVSIYWRKRTDKIRVITSLDVDGRKRARLGRDVT